jgi:hypothetical protein
LISRDKYKSLEREREREREREQGSTVFDSYFSFYMGFARACAFRKEKIITSGQARCHSA